MLSLKQVRSTMTFKSFPGDDLKLLIAAKARNNSGNRVGFCYIGCDMERHKLIRPVLRQSSSRWFPERDKDLKKGELHLFKIVKPELEGISHPHRANDVLVKYNRSCVQPDPAADHSDFIELYNILEGQSHETVKNVFGNLEDFNGQYFLEHTKCPSVGVYRCKKENLEIIITEKGERRCKITEEGTIVGNYKITAVGDDPPDLDSSEDVLVILGLSRPYPGSSRQYEKLRCYIMVVGFVTKSTNPHQHSQLRHDIQSTSGIFSDVRVLSPQSQGPLHAATERNIKRKLEFNYAAEGKFGSQRFKRECFPACPIDENLTDCQSI